MIGLPAWGVRQGHGSFLTFEFGEPKLEVSERESKRGLVRSAYVQGFWHLWIYCCHWRVFQDGAELAWSEDSNETIRRATATLNGQKLLAVSVDAVQGGSTFTFDLGGSLVTWPYGDDPTEEQWTVINDGKAFAVRADGYYRHDPVDAVPNQERWLTLP